MNFMNLGSSKVGLFNRDQYSYAVRLTNRHRSSEVQLLLTFRTAFLSFTFRIIFFHISSTSKVSRWPQIIIDSLQRVNDTLRRGPDDKKPIVLLRIFCSKARTQDNTVISFSRPWKLSTVPTSTLALLQNFKQWNWIFI